MREAFAADFVGSEAEKHRSARWYHCKTQRRGDVLSAALSCPTSTCPGMTGLEMLPKVKTERPNVPVIMITAYWDDVTRRRASELGAADCFSGPRSADF